MFLIFFVGNTGSKFTLNSTSGVLALTSTLDYETMPVFTLVIHAEDSQGAVGAKFSVFTVTVKVIDINDNAPTFSNAQYVLDVPETTTAGATVFTFLANDPDAGSNGLVSYTLTKGSDMWILNTTSGALLLNGKFIVIMS